MKYVTDDGSEFSTSAEARAYERQSQKKAKAEASHKEKTSGLISYFERMLPSADTAAITAVILRDIAGFAEAVMPLLRKRAPRRPRADKTATAKEQTVQRRPRGRPRKVRPEDGPTPPRSDA